jgi:hypothetical protein
MLALFLFPLYLVDWMMILPIKFLGWLFKGIWKLFWIVCIGILVFFP